ncbi:MAG: hypothetical protein A2Y25_06080 [Candidatus Melainabacteria bacterium GWF2_37_15]|nr:MAG: hypothetical protein A2Y25_06080 [Candidatus Melainabacteria bacterium GWF2_37_15]
MNSKDEILDKLKELKPLLEKDYNVTEIGLFGSYIRNEQKPDSDIDILVNYKPDTSLFTLGGLQYMLSEIFGKKVDIIMKNSLKKRTGKHILSEVVYV